MTFIQTPGPSSGNGNINKPGRKAIERLLDSKRSVVRIYNEDELCCARAIVTMQAWCHKDDNVNGIRNYDNLRRVRPIQTRLAELFLHMQAGIPFGPCGTQVKIISPRLLDFLSLMFYSKLVFLASLLGTPTISSNPALISAESVVRGCTPLHGPPAVHVIQLIKVDEHYHGCMSFGGFLSKSYFCRDCNRAFDHDDIENHPCVGKKCPSCERKGCVDFFTAKIQ